MKLIFIFLGLLFSMVLWAEIWQKPAYTPDEGHIQEEMERQEERPKQEKEKQKDNKHQDVRKPESNPGFEMIDDEMSEDEESSL